MSPVHKLSQIGSLTGNKIDYPSMLAGYGDFGALQRIRYGALSSAGIDITNVPATYQDLFLVLQLRSTAAVTTTSSILYFNGDASATNYSRTTLQGDGSSASSSRDVNYSQLYFADGTPGANSTANIFSVVTINILNYANTSTFKAVLMRTAADLNGSGITNLVAGLWRSTSAINRLSAGAVSGSYATGSTFALYGVKASAA